MLRTAGKKVQLLFRLVRLLVLVVGWVDFCQTRHIMHPLCFYNVTACDTATFMHTITIDGP